MSLSLADGTVGSIHYTLRDEEGKVLDSSAGGEPLHYLHGGGQIVVGLEAALTGRVAGERLQVVVPPAEGYGERRGPGPQEVPRSEFDRRIPLEVGMALQARDSSGRQMIVYVTEIRGSRVFLDTNHPLAGKNLHFDVEVVGVRAATAEELDHGHAHGPGGHHHH